MGAYPSLLAVVVSYYFVYNLLAAGLVALLVLQYSDSGV
jgi:hypothetical protein